MDIETEKEKETNIKMFLIPKVTKNIFPRKNRKKFMIMYKRIEKIQK